MACPSVPGTGTVQAKPPASCGWRSAQAVEEDNSPSALVCFSSWRAGQPGDRRQSGRGLWGGLISANLDTSAERGGGNTWEPHQRCWGPGLSDTKQTAKQPTEDSEVILRLTHSIGREECARSKSAPPEPETSRCTGWAWDGAPPSPRCAKASREGPVLTGVPSQDLRLARDRMRVEQRQL